MTRLEVFNKFKENNNIGLMLVHDTFDDNTQYMYCKGTQCENCYIRVMCNNIIDHDAKSWFPVIERSVLTQKHPELLL